MFSKCIDVIRMLVLFKIDASGYSLKVSIYIQQKFLDENLWEE